MNELIRTNLRKKKNGKKGFTLVEVIVVLVILAILAAILIPAMTGWMKKAGDKGAIIEARTMKVAIQTIVSENFKNAALKANSDLTAVPVGTKTDATATLMQASMELAEAKSPASVSDIKIDTNKAVTYFVYDTSDGGKTVIYDESQGTDKAYKVTDK